ncbi:hypothetical protein [Nostocoides sp. HKS02]|uniref:hypothetical protein n=1 Tax=Nostocoides sp. HKS02 TaxID=1813880 RepID=UPI0012B4DDDE|nr:hypothetical protein [Tetrasphaera sp. HKS02]QGN57726.1 hypothetical protein GKE56_07370 [Tetrasphaera sp. HKS02]
MISTIRQAVLTTEFDERQLTALLVNAGSSAGPAALGVVIANVVSSIRRDRKQLRSWLAGAGEMRA